MSWPLDEATRIENQSEKHVKGLGFRVKRHGIGIIAVIQGVKNLNYVGRVAVTMASLMMMIQDASLKQPNIGNTLLIHPA